MPLVQDLLNGGELPNADEVESLEKYTVEDHLPGVFLNGTIAVSRMPGTSGVRVGEDGPFLLLCDTELNELSDLRLSAGCRLRATFRTMTCLRVWLRSLRVCLRRRMTRT